MDEIIIQEGIQLIEDSEVVYNFIMESIGCKEYVIEESAISDIFKKLKEWLTQLFARIKEWLSKTFGLMKGNLDKDIRFIESNLDAINKGYESFDKNKKIDGYNLVDDLIYRSTNLCGVLEGNIRLEKWFVVLDNDMSKGLDNKKDLIGDEDERIKEFLKTLILDEHKSSANNIDTVDKFYSYLETCYGINDGFNASSAQYKPNSILSYIKSIKNHKLDFINRQTEFMNEMIKHADKLNVVGSKSEEHEFKYAAKYARILKTACTVLNKRIVTYTKFVNIYRRQAMQLVHAYRDNANTKNEQASIFSSISFI